MGKYLITMSVGLSDWQKLFVPDSLRRVQWHCHYGIEIFCFHQIS